MNKGDVFWIADAPDEGWVNSAAAAVELYYGDCCILKPVEVERAVFLPNIWVVLEENDDGIIEHFFSTKEEAEQFCQKKIEAQND